MRWEELKVYRPLTREQLKPAFKDFTKIVANNLEPFGFSLHGRKLICHCNDLLQIIHLDTRGSWMGVSEYFNTMISLVCVSDKSPFVRGFELTGSKRLELLATGIRDYCRITQEYHLLADYLTEKIVEYVIPYFDKYDSTRKVLTDRKSFQLGDRGSSNENLILFCELQNKTVKEAINIIDRELGVGASSLPAVAQYAEYYDELQLYKQAIISNDWNEIEQKLEQNKKEVLKKLKIK